MNRSTRLIGLTAILTLGACGQGLQSDPGVTHPDGAVDGQIDPLDAQIDPPDGRIDDPPDGSTGPDAPPPVRFSACGAFGSGGARAIAAATDLPRAVVGYGSGRAVLIDTASLSVRLELPAHERRITSAAMSKDGQRSATSSETGEIIVSRTDDGQALARIQTGELPLPLSRLALSPDGGLVAARDNQGLHLWRVDDGSLLWTRPEGDPELLRFLDDGQTLLSGGSGLVSFRRVTDGTIEREASYEGVNASPRLSDANGDGTLMVGALSGGFGLWRTGQKPAVWTQIDPSPDYLRPQLSSDGATLAFRAKPSGTRLARLSDGSVLGSFPGLSASLAFDHTGSLLIGDSDGTLHRISTSAHEEMVVPAPPGHGGPLLQVAFSPDGHLFATSATEGADASGGYGELFTVKVWRAQDGILLFTSTTAHLGTRRSFAFSPDSASLAVVGPDGRIRLLQASDGRELTVMGDEVQGVAFTSDGRSLVGSTLARYDRRAIRRWRIADGAEEPGFGARGIGAMDFAFSPDGSVVAIIAGSSSSIEGLSLWPVTDESPLWSARVAMDGFPSLTAAFSPDGSRIAISNLQVFATSDGYLIKDLRPAGWYRQSFASGVSYSRDGAHVAFTDDSVFGALRVFRTSDWMPEETRPGAFGAVAFSPTEDRLLLGGNDYIVRLLCQE